MNASSPGKTLMTSIKGLLSSQESDANAQGDGLSSWVQSVPIGQPEHVVRGFIEQVLIIRQERQNVRAQFKQLEILLKGAEPHIRELEALLDQSSLPLSTQNREIATTVDSLLKAFAQTYYELAETLGSKWFRVLHAKQQPLAALRAAQLIHRRAQIAYRVYSNGSAQRWKQYRALLTMNEEATRDSKDETSVSSAESLSRIVVQSSLIALTDPTTLNEEDITRVRLYCERYGHLAVLSPTPLQAEAGAIGIFVLTDHKRGPHRPKADLPALGKCHYLDTRPLLNKLQQQVQGLRAGTPPSRLGLPGTANHPSYLAVLERCFAQWSEPQQRRHMRNGVRPHADLVSGFDAVYRFVAQNALSRRKTDESKKDVELPVSEWSIIDQSEGGFGLRFVNGHAGAISVGEVVALRFKDRAAVAICIARRARNVSGSEFEIGLELLADKAVATHTTRQLPDNASPKPDPDSPALLLPRLANGHKCPGVVLPSGRSRQPVEFTVRSNGTPIRLIGDASLEHLASCELLKLKPTRI